jgi:lipid II:glycine glycyltransferase (peptidoglycan interpeptide bridge formation enzyme)
MRESILGRVASGRICGVYRFKRGFGGAVRRAAQAVDRIFNPLLYRAYLLRASMLGAS